MKKKSIIKYKVNGVWTTKIPKDFSKVEMIDEVVYMTKKDWEKMSKILNK
jgi:hypothetical protein